MKESRVVVARAADEARALGEPQVLPAHLLLGIIAYGGAAARAVGIDYGDLRSRVVDAQHDRNAAALETLGIDLDAVLDRIEQGFGTGALQCASGRPTFAATTKYALEGALRAAVELRDSRIGPSHILLGVLAVEDPSVTRLLESTDTSADQVRAAVLAQRAAPAG